MTSMLCWCMLGLFSETSSDDFHVVLVYVRFVLRDKFRWLPYCVGVC